MLGVLIGSDETCCHGATTGITIWFMAVTKRSVSLDDSIAARVERAAVEEGVSFSAWLTRAAEHSLLIREGIQGVTDWEADAGPLTAEELAAGEVLLDRLLRDTTRESA